MEPSSVPDWPRTETLEGSYDIVRSLRSLYECQMVANAQRLLEELMNKIQMHRDCLRKVEDFAQDLVIKQFGLPKKDSAEDIGPASAADEELSILDSTAQNEEKNTPQMATKLEQLDYPIQVRFTPGQEIRACVGHALSPLEFHIIRSSDIEMRRSIQRALTDRLPHLPVLDEQKDGGPCAVIYKKDVYRGLIEMSGKSDVLVRLIDYGTCHFVQRKHVFVLPADLLIVSQPLAYFCCLADTEKCWTTNAVITDFSMTVSHTPEVLVTACGSLHESNREIVYLPVEEQKTSRAAQQSPARKRVKKNHEKNQHVTTGVFIIV